MLNLDKKYKLPSYCSIQKIEDKNQGLLKEGVTSQFIFQNYKIDKSFFINESISDFLQLFINPFSFKDCLNALNTSLDENDKLNDDDILPFFKNMIKRGFLIAEEKNESLQERIEPVFDDYHIIEIFKSSNKEMVCLASRKKDDKLVVLKFIDYHNIQLSEKRKRKHERKFAQEFDIMQTLNHPNICQVIDFDPSNHFAVIQYIKGIELKKMIKNGNLKYSEKTQIIKNICDVMSFLHHNNVIHGDIHAKQFIVNENGIPILIDFGFSNRAQNLEYEIIKRGGINYFLEPENIIPSAFKSVKKYTPSKVSEVYRMGVLFYFLLYEDYPFSSFSWKNLCKKIKTETPIFKNTTKLNEIIHPDLIGFVKLLLSKEPKDRPDSAVDFKKYLTDIL